MFKYHYLIILLAFSLSSLAVAKEVVYEYKNSDGNVEFTDVPKKNEQPIDEMHYKKMTEQEKEQGKEKLEQIIEDDKALDKRLEKEREQELAIEKQKQTERKLRETAETENRPTEVAPINNNYYPDGRIVTPRPLPIQRPIKPINRPGPRR